MEDDFGELKNGWEVFIAYVGGWIVIALSLPIAVLFLRGFVFLFSGQGGGYSGGGYG